MSDASATCSRCLRELKTAPTRITVASEMPDAVGSELALCGRCAHSFSHWARTSRRGRHTTRSGSSENADTHRTERSSRQRLKTWKTRLKKVAIYCGLAAFFFLILYRLLGGIARPPTSE